jgi:MFS family permease
VLESCPHDNRIAHISIANLLIGLPLALVPVGAGFLADASGIRTLFLVCLALTLTSLVWLLRFVRDPRWLPVSPEAATAP